MLTSGRDHFLFRALVLGARSKQSGKREENWIWVQHGTSLLPGFGRRWRRCWRTSLRVFFHPHRALTQVSCDQSLCPLSVLIVPMRHNGAAFYVHLATESAIVSFPWALSSLSSNIYRVIWTGIWQCDVKWELHYAWRSFKLEVEFRIVTHTGTSWPTKW